MTVLPPTWSVTPFILSSVYYSIPDSELLYVYPGDVLFKAVAGGALVPDMARTVTTVAGDIARSFHRGPTLNSCPSRQTKTLVVSS